MQASSHVGCPPPPTQWRPSCHTPSNVLLSVVVAPFFVASTPSTCASPSGTSHNASSTSVRAAQSFMRQSPRLARPGTMPQLNETMSDYCMKLQQQRSHVTSVTQTSPEPCAGCPPPHSATATLLPHHQCLSAGCRGRPLNHTHKDATALRN